MDGINNGVWMVTLVATLNPPPLHNPFWDSLVIGVGGGDDGWYCEHIQPEMSFQISESVSQGRIHHARPIKLIKA